MIYSYLKKIKKKFLLIFFFTIFLLFELRAEMGAAFERPGIEGFEGRKRKSISAPRDGV